MIGSGTHWTRGDGTVKKERPERRYEISGRREELREQCGGPNRIPRV